MTPRAVRVFSIEPTLWRAMQCRDLRLALAIFFGPAAAHFVLLRTSVEAAAKARKPLIRGP